MGMFFFFQTPDDGDICIVDGLIEMRPGLETMAYICLFGGNKEDDGSQKNPFTWWGNTIETDDRLHIRSEFQYITESLPLTSNNILRAEEAAKRDLPNIHFRKYR